MQFLPEKLSFINTFVINISLIISTVLTLYFVSLYIGTNKNRTKLSFVSSEWFHDSNKHVQVLVGIALGFISFILSINRIPIFGETNGVDMRYAIIYFAVIYGSSTLGIVSSITLVTLKTVGYLSALPPIIFSEYLNNVVLTFVLLGFAIYLKKTKQPTWRSHFFFLTAFLILRFVTYIFYFHPFFQATKIAEFIIYMVIYSGIFLLASYVIAITMTVSQSVHVYRTAAIFDGLTGLYNKESFHFFLDYVANLAANEETTLSLSVLDIDNFKQINDNYGHPVGDQVLAHFSAIILAISKEYVHYICRIGGDEFAIIHNESPKDSLEFLEKLFVALEKEPFIFEEDIIPIKLSAGLAHFHSDDQLNVEVALKEADKALYQAKSNGKNQIYVKTDK